MTAILHRTEAERTAFDAMRADLVARGLIGADDGRLTEAGNAHVSAMIGQLLRAEAPSDPSAPRVRWSCNRQFGGVAA
ncbi:MAG: hypothetical protein KGL44_03810 [Sphingomonadales bacterium]|nr:hypothetical protein [Sphingomonadales bacterium]